MFYTIYKTINKIDGKIYIGKHQTNYPSDKYLGSGKHLNRAIKKHGIENFVKEVLFIFDNEAEMNAKEAELVTENFVKQDTNYNLCPGGQGGFGHIRNMESYNEQVVLGRINANKAIEQKYGVSNYSKTDDFKKLNSKHMKNQYRLGIRKNTLPSFEGKKHTEETKKTIGLKNSINQRGNNNSQFGKVWIYSLEEKKSIRINEGEPLPEGWKLGRKMKFE